MPVAGVAQAVTLLHSLSIVLLNSIALDIKINVFIDSKMVMFIVIFHFIYLYR